MHFTPNQSYHFPNSPRIYKLTCTYVFNEIVTKYNNLYGVQILVHVRNPVY